ncbi:hypothetical protein [Halospeciosus flavus]|uniref:hypothetical protein n=1 Tax=Halospeciosus flavus TaxID=3032283 RepID=UPI00360BA4CA
MAKTIEGTGTISVDGESGSSGNNFGNNSNGGSGAGYSIPATGASGTGGTNPSVGTNRYYDGNNWNGNNGGGSGNAHSSVYNDSTLKPYLEDYLLSGAYITQSPLDTLLPGSGDSGAGGGNEQLRMYNPANHGNNNNNYGSYVDVGGGGGGAGGSFASKGGGGGNGDDDQANKNHYLSHQSNNDTSYNSYARANVRGGEGALAVALAASSYSSPRASVSVSRSLLREDRAVTASTAKLMDTTATTAVAPRTSI